MLIVVGDGNVCVCVLCCECVNGGHRHVYSSRRSTGTEWNTLKMRDAAGWYATIVWL